MLRFGVLVFLLASTVIAETPENYTSVPPPTLTQTTAVASPLPSVDPNATLPAQAAAPVPQSWCPSKIFCSGELLQTVNLAMIFADPKTFVDKPTNASSQQVIADFEALAKAPSSNNSSNISVTTASVINFVASDFRGEGLELSALSLSNFSVSPAFIANVTEPVLKSWSKIVHGYWSSLIRGTNKATLCDGLTCESTLIPLNHTFVVPGGRFREQYYWDSYWMVLGLLESELYSIVNGTLQNFMDEIEKFGFIPNGGRIYYLNRSQPPLFIQMLAAYVSRTKDTSILTRALPLAERELQWWMTNRSINVTSSYSNKTYTMSRYSVTNSAPRPESYLTDYVTANDATAALNETQRSALYAELASGAETGWDYSSRWMGSALYGTAGLRTLQVTTTIPVDLNSILYKNHMLMAEFYKSTNATLAASHTSTASSLRAGILDLFFDSSKLAFYDYNLKSSARNTIFTAASYYPLWSGIIPDTLLSSKDKAFGFFASLNLVMNRFNGTVPTTFISTTGQQWDSPNTWPPHTYIALEALRNLPANISSGALPQPNSSDASTYSLIPVNQLNLTEAELPGQTIANAANASTSGPSADINRLNGTVINGGNATANEGWRDTLERELANRYIVSAYCSWRATGGSINDSTTGVVIPRLNDQELNVTDSINNTGIMFEKFSILDVDSSGRGGEYTVQTGFGWTNGVVLYIASTYGKVLAAPQCPPIDLNAGNGGGNSNAASSRITSVGLGQAIAVVLVLIGIVLKF